MLAVRKLVALAPERAEQFWKRHAKGFPKDEAERLIEEYTVARNRNHSASGKNGLAITPRLNALRRSNALS